MRKQYHCLLLQAYDVLLHISSRDSVQASFKHDWLPVETICIIIVKSSLWSVTRELVFLGDRRPISDRSRTFCQFGHFCHFFLTFRRALVVEISLSCVVSVSSFAPSMFRFISFLAVFSLSTSFFFASSFYFRLNPFCITAKASLAALTNLANPYCSLLVSIKPWPHSESPFPGHCNLSRSLASFPHCRVCSDREQREGRKKEEGATEGIRGDERKQKLQAVNCGTLRASTRGRKKEGKAEKSEAEKVMEEEKEGATEHKRQQKASNL